MNTKFLLAPDKFKGSLTALEVCRLIEDGIRQVLPDAEVMHCPIADGGDGFVEVLCDAAGGDWVECGVQDALGRRIEARYALAGESAMMEMSSASGIRHIAESDRDVWRSSSYGTGQMMRHAIEHYHVKKIILGIGGSATNDGGCGMAAALGVRFFDSSGRKLKAHPLSLLDCVKIDLSNLIQIPEILVASDVSNPLFGEDGATTVYGPQKGVKKGDIDRFEFFLKKIVSLSDGEKEASAAGAGAAGGLGFGLMKFCNAELVSGFDLVAKELDLLEKIKQADVVITGEGKLDQQTMNGKGPAGVAALAHQFGKRAFAIAGMSEPEVTQMFESVFTLHDGKRPLSETIKMSPELIKSHAAKLAASL